MIKGIKFAGLPVGNQDRSLAFFRDKLGFTVATDQPFDDKQRWIELKIKGSDTHLVLFTPAGHEDRIGGYSNITFYSDSVEKTYDEMVARGVEFTAPPKKEPWGTSAIFKDPDGTMFVLASR